MVLGNTAETLQRVANLADDVYSRLNDVRNQLEELHDTVDRTDERVARLETEVAEQRAILDALAENRGIDVESAVADAHIDEAERDATPEDKGEGESDGDLTTSDGDASDGPPA